MLDGCTSKVGWSVTTDLSVGAYRDDAEDKDVQQMASIQGYSIKKLQKAKSSWL